MNNNFIESRETDVKLDENNKQPKNISEVVDIKIGELNSIVKNYSDSCVTSSEKGKYFTVIVIIFSFIQLIVAGLSFYSSHQTNDFSQKSRAFDTLTKIEDRIKDRDAKVISVLEKNEPLLTENKGMITDEEFENYLDDVMSVQLAEEEKIINISQAYTWFFNDFDIVVNNNEAMGYIKKIRSNNTSSQDFYGGFEEFWNRMKKGN
jgi:hypothetical protein